MRGGEEEGRKERQEGGGGGSKKDIEEVKIKGGGDYRNGGGDKEKKINAGDREGRRNKRLEVDRLGGRIRIKEEGQRKKESDSDLAAFICTNLCWSWLWLPRRPQTRRKEY